MLEIEAREANAVKLKKDPSPPTGQLSVEEFDRWLDQLKELPEIALPAISCDYTREDIYFDHD